MSADIVATSHSSPSTSSFSASSSDAAAAPAAQLTSSLDAASTSNTEGAGKDVMKFDAARPVSMSLSSPISLPLVPFSGTSPLLPAGSLIPSPFFTPASLLSASGTSPVSPTFTPDSLQSLLMSLRATSSPTASSGSMPLLPIQLLPGPLLVLPSLHSPNGLQRHHSLPHPKLMTFSVSSVMHEDIPSSIHTTAPTSPTPSALAGHGSSSSNGSGSAMELSPYASPQSPLSPLSGSSTDSDDSSRDSSSDDDKSKHSKRSKKSRKSLKRPSSLSETDSENDTDSTHSASSASSASSSEAHEAKKRRCVVSAQKLLTDNTTAIDLSLSILHFHTHSIRIIHTHTTHGHTACYVHGADVGGVIERKSNISRMFGQFASPTEKVLMNVTGKHNHTVGQEANVLTVAGVERLMTLKKCAPNTEYCEWLRNVLLPRLKEGNSQSGGRVGEEGEAEAEAESEEGNETRDRMGVKSETEGEVVNVMTSLLTAAV